MQKTTIIYPSAHEELVLLTFYCLLTHTEYLAYSTDYWHTPIIGTSLYLLSAALRTPKYTEIHGKLHVFYLRPSCALSMPFPCPSRTLPAPFPCPFHALLSCCLCLDTGRLYNQQFLIYCLCVIFFQLTAMSHRKRRPRIKLAPAAVHLEKTGPSKQR